MYISSHKFTHIKDKSKTTFCFEKKKKMEQKLNFALLAMQKKERDEKNEQST